MNITDNFLLNEILLRRKNKLILSKESNQVSDNNIQYISTVMKNLEDLGYTLSKEIVDILYTYTISEIQGFYLNLIPIIKRLIGANVVYNPMYPNFPASVMNKEESELYFNAIIHYWSNGVLYPNEQKDGRLPLFDVNKVKIINLGTMNDIQEIVNNLCNSKTSLSQIDKDDIQQIYMNNKFIIPSNIVLKETVAFVSKIYIENHLSNIEQCYKMVSPLINTATDVLRLITVMSEGDISLASNTKYKSFKRKERYLLLKLLDECCNLEEDMYRYKNRWIRIGERLHPNEYSNVFYNVEKSFNNIRNNSKSITTFNSKVEKFIKDNQFEDLSELLKTRPGEFARRLDLLLRKSNNKEVIINNFKSVAQFVATPILWQVKNHFEYRNNLKYRVFFPKGNTAKSYFIENDLVPLDDKYCNMIILICKNALVNNYQKKDFMGNVYISEQLKNYTIPFSQRSASNTLKTITRGSRLPIEYNTNILRAFIWWTNLSNGQIVDVDLSAALFDENWSYVSHISYTNLKDTKLNACHSGDIINGGDVKGQGVAEFIDIDVNKCITNNVRYVVYQVFNFSKINFNLMDNCMFGWMNRKDSKCGEIFEPKTVKQKMNLTSKSVYCVPVIFDLVNQEFIWCDINMTVNTTCNLESTLTNTLATCYNMINVKKPNLYELFKINTFARGIEVDNKEDADIIFDIENNIDISDDSKQIITPFDLDVIVGQYL